jgi:hypothetical protein
VVEFDMNQFDRGFPVFGPMQGHLISETLCKWLWLCKRVKRAIDLFGGSEPLNGTRVWRWALMGCASVAGSVRRIGSAVRMDFCCLRASRRAENFLVALNLTGRAQRF